MTFVRQNHIFAVSTGVPIHSFTACRMKFFTSKSTLLLIVLLGVSYTPSAHAQEGLRAGIKAPNFELPTINGNKISLGSFLDKNIVILHFWKSK